MEETVDMAKVFVEAEDCLFPYLRVSVSERAIYYQLLRHSRLMGLRSVRVSRRSLSQASGLSLATIFNRINSLADKGCIRILERSHAGHLLEVLLPSEVQGCVEANTGARPIDLEAANCYRNPPLQAALLRREDGLCFYCLRRLRMGAASFDHVVPASAGGDNSYRNVVASCHECNSRKGSHPADEFLRQLYRSGCITAPELEARLAALESLRAGQSKPILDR